MTSYAHLAHFTSRAAAGNAAAELADSGFTCEILDCASVAGTTYRKGWILRAKRDLDMHQRDRIPAEVAEVIQRNGGKWLFSVPESGEIITGG